MKRLLVLVISFITSACSDGGQSSLSPDGAAPVTDCQARCISKLTGCGATSSQAMQLCPTVCGKSPTESQMQCLEGQPCSADLDEAMDECGIGQMPMPADAGTSMDAPEPPDAMIVCIEPGAIRYVCQCSPGLEVRGCTNPPDVCTDLCPDENCGNGAVCMPE